MAAPPASLAPGLASSRTLAALTAALALASGLGTGCSVRKVALRSAADALSSGTGGTFARDDDPALVRDAIPFALKTMESLADGLDDHAALRQALASGFTQYGYAFLAQEAEEVQGKEPARALELRARARRLYLRARDYGLEGLKISRGITLEALRGDEAARTSALALAAREDLGLLYWTLVPWAAAIAADKGDFKLVGDLPLLASILDRALALDETYEGGALHEFSLAFDGARLGGTTKEKQEAHFARALELSKGQKLSLKVSYVENVVVPAQDKKKFDLLLGEVVKSDTDAPEVRGLRLANLIAQRRARFLLSHSDDFIND